MTNLFESLQREKSTAVECLGITFPDEKSRRIHFLKLLAEKLKEHAFRDQEGFPTATDEEILALSDPPYFTACPNPWATDFVNHFGKPFDQDEPYLKTPFAADVKEGKGAPIYNAHSYHTKVPHKAVMRYILHYTNPGDVMLDSFCGTGMTGVAAQMCGDRREVESLGYQIDSEGTVFEQHQEGTKSVWSPISKIGPRYCVMNDLSPAAAFIAHNFNMPASRDDFTKRANEILSDAKSKFGWLYRTLHEPGAKDVERAIDLIKRADAPNLQDIAQTGWVNFIIWSDVFICPECQAEITYWHSAVDREKGSVLDEFECPSCSVRLTKRRVDRAWKTYFDSGLRQTHRQVKQVPVAINYSIGNKRYEKPFDEADQAIFDRATSDLPEDWYPINPLMQGDKTGEPLRIGVTHSHQFHTNRALVVLSFLRKRVFEQIHDCPTLGLWFTSSLPWSTRLNRLHTSNYFGGGGGVVIPNLQGTLYISSLAAETNPIERFSLRVSSAPFTAPASDAIVSTGSASKLPLCENSIDYIFLDPPFGSNIMYSELNFIWESWIRVSTNAELEAIENKSQNKSVNDYRRLMTACFREAFRVLKPGRWLTVEFSNTKASVWNSIQTALQEAGFVVANVSALEKTHKGFKAVTTTTAVKQDLVISAYKPSSGLEKRIAQASGGEESVWDFVRSHLSYLPIYRIGAGQFEFIAEREPRIIFDRMVTWFVRRNRPVPLSSHEFRDGLMKFFVERDGMIFLPEQISEYEKRRALAAQTPQKEMFVSDERSAIDWITDFLRRRPSTYQEISPEFISQLGAGWKKHEARPELSSLLEDNFLRYDGHYCVPNQIHSYLSTNFKDLRGLEKDDLRLKAKAKNRWYVPDPSKAKDLEQKRERSMLKEFEVYKTAPGRRLKEFRLEVLRAGFKTAWAARDYKTIIGIAQKIPEQALQEDEKLLLWYDQALTRMETAA